jgi:hypothetical protein
VIHDRDAGPRARQPQQEISHPRHR